LAKKFPVKKTLSKYRQTATTNSQGQQHGVLTMSER